MKTKRKDVPSLNDVEGTTVVGGEPTTHAIEKVRLNTILNSLQWSHTFPEVTL